jgi:hypothetical protein
VTGSKWVKSKRRLAQHLAQGRVQQVGGGVVERGGLARGGIDLGADRVADRQCPGVQPAEVQVGQAVLARVGDHETPAGGVQLTVVADLAAGLGIERRALEHHGAVVAGRQGVDAAAVAQQRHHPALAGQVAVAGEGGDRVELRQGAVVDPELAGRAGPLALGRHRPVEAGLVDA